MKPQKTQASRALVASLALLLAFPGCRSESASSPATVMPGPAADGLAMNFVTEMEGDFKLGKKEEIVLQARQLEYRPPSGGGEGEPRGPGYDAPADEPRPGKVRRMVIRNASLELRAEQPAEAARGASRVAEELGGFVVRSDAYGSGESLSQVSVELRVPAERFEEALGRLRGLGLSLRESITGQDVTAEYTDLEAQLRAKRALETSFLEILGRAQSVEDTLKVEAELGRVREEIDRLEGRTRYLRDQASLSTIALTVSAPYQPYAPQAESLGSRLGRAFQEGGELFVQSLEGMIAFVGGALPLVLALAPLAFLLRAWRRRRALARASRELMDASR